MIHERQDYILKEQKTFSRRHAAPFSETLPYLCGIGCGLRFFQKQMELVGIIPCGNACVAVECNTVPYLILNNQHTRLFQILRQFLNVIADKAVVDVHRRSVVEEVKGSRYIQVKRLCYPVGFR